MSVCLLAAVIVVISFNAGCVRACVPAAAAVAYCRLTPWGLSGVYRFICAVGDGVECWPAPPRGIGACYYTSRPRVSTFGGRVWRQPAGLRRLRYHITTASCCTGSSATCSISPFSNCRCPSLAAACRLPLAAVRRLPPVAARGRRSLLAFSPPLATQRLGAKSCSTRDGCVNPLRALSSLQGRMCRKPRYATGFVSTQLFFESRHKPADASVPYIYMYKTSPA